LMATVYQLCYKPAGSYALPIQIEIVDR
jgi:hypothetical protein